MRNGTYEIKVAELEENEDGSATLELEMSEDTKTLLIEAGLISLIRKYLDEVDNETTSETN
jgi:hypothetical protein